MEPYFSILSLFVVGTLKVTLESHGTPRQEILAFFCQFGNFLTYLLALYCHFGDFLPNLVALFGLILTPWNPKEPYGGPWSLMEPHGTQKNPMEAHGASWNPMEPHGIPWNPMESHGTPWNSMEENGTPRNQCFPILALFCKLGNFLPNLVALFGLALT